MGDSRQMPDIEQLICDFEKSSLRELHARHGEFEIYLSNDPDAAGLDGSACVQVSRSKPVPVAAAQAAKGTVASAPATAEIDVPEGAYLVRAPYLGTFYRAPKPGAAPFVDEGQAVSEDTEMCLVEVMKLFTAVRAECTGTVAAVLAEDGEMVAADQPLFIVTPA